MSKFPALLKQDYRILSLSLACAIYACFGSPTPSHFGWPELLVAGLLVLSIGIGRALTVVGENAQDAAFWQKAGRIWLLYGLIVTTIMGVSDGHDKIAIVRDIIPFLFLFLPLFLSPLIAASQTNFLMLQAAMVLIGLVFSARSLLTHDDPLDPLYLENMPTVLFAALLLIGLAVERLMRGWNIKIILPALGLLALSLLPLAAMAAVHQRASLGAVAFYLAAVFLYLFVKKPARALSVFTLLVLLTFAAGISVSGLMAMVSDKTAAVGLNMRPQEMAAVWNVVTGDPLTFLLGIGWGGHFHSPAVGGVNVNFTHNFFSSVLLKSGFCGVLLAMAYVLGLQERLYHLILKNPMTGIAIAAPVFIDLTLYASFKSLDFGLMLLMISSSLVYFGNSRTESCADRRCADRL